MKYVSKKEIERFRKKDLPAIKDHTKTELRACKWGFAKEIQKMLEEFLEEKFKV